MFKLMFLCPHQKMNKLCVKIYPTKVAILVMLEVRSKALSANYFVFLCLIYISIKCFC